MLGEIASQVLQRNRKGGHPDLFRFVWISPFSSDLCSLFQRFRKEVGGRGLATNNAQNTAKIVSQNGVLLLIRGHRKRGQKKGLNLWCGRDFLVPTPSVRQPLFETSDCFREYLGGPRTPPFGPSLCTRFRNKKIRKSKNQKWSLRNDFPCRHNFLSENTEMGSVKNSFFEGHEVI